MKKRSNDKREAQQHASEIYKTEAWKKQELPPGIKSWGTKNRPDGSKELAYQSNHSATVTFYEGNWLALDIINASSYYELETGREVSIEEIRTKYKWLAKYCSPEEIKKIACSAPGEIEPRKKAIEIISKVTRRDPDTVRKDMQPYTLLKIRKLK